MSKFKKTKQESQQRAEIKYLAAGLTFSLIFPPSSRFNFILLKGTEIIDIIPTVVRGQCVPTGYYYPQYFQESSPPLLPQGRIPSKVLKKYISDSLHWGINVSSLWVIVLIMRPCERTPAGSCVFGNPTPHSPANFRV